MPLALGEWRFWESRMLSRVVSPPVKELGQVHAAVRAMHAKQTGSKVAVVVPEAAENGTVQMPGRDALLIGVGDEAEGERSPLSRWRVGIDTSYFLSIIYQVYLFGTTAYYLMHSNCMGGEEGSVAALQVEWHTHTRWMRKLHALVPVR